MQSTMELTELDELVAHLDARISEVEVPSDAAAPSVLLCSLLGDCDYDGSWRWC